MNVLHIQPDQLLLIEGGKEWKKAKEFPEIFEDEFSTQPKSNYEDVPIESKKIESWYLLVNGATEGPYTLQSLKQLGISADSTVLLIGTSQWKKATYYPELLQRKKVFWAPLISVTNRATEPLQDWRLVFLPQFYSLSLIYVIS